MKSLPLDAFLHFRFLGQLKTSPKEKSFAFLSAQAHEENNEYHHTLYLSQNDKIRKVMQLKKNNDFIYLSDERLLINLQKNKAEQKALKEASKQSFYTYDIDKKALEKAFDLPFPAKLEAVIDAHTLLLSAAMSEDDHVLYEGDDEARKAYLKEKKKASAFEDIEQLPYMFDGMNFVANKQKQLFLFDLITHQVTRLFDKDFSFEQYSLSEDKKKLYYTGKKKEKLMSMTSNIYVCDIDNETHQVLYDKRDYGIVKIELIKDQLLVLAKDYQAYGLNQNPDFYLLKDNELKPLKSYGQSFGNTVGTDVRLLASEMTFVKKGRFYFVATIDDHSELKSIDLNGDLQTEYVMDGSINGILSYQDKLYTIALYQQRLEELYQLDLEAQKLLMCSRFNAKVLSDYYVAKPKTLEVEKTDHTVKGFVLLPKDYQADIKYPAILDIHGGPKTVYGQVYYHEMQYWANQGYIVFFANPRGSDGKGDVFADIRGKYGTIDYDDLMAFTDLVLKTYPAIDQENLFVTGGSYGGFMTNWIVSHNNRFKAAVTQRSISNWLSFYGTSDIGYFFAHDQTGGHPLLDREKLYEQSPIKHALNIKTPLLFIHADHDHRCPIEQAQQLYAILRTEDVDTKLVWIKNESHGLSRGGRPQARVKRLKEITGWFDKYLKA